jgi:hypothetical protein
MRLDWKQAAPALLIGLILGGAAGAGLQRAALRKAWRQGPDPARMLRRFERKLDLDAEQKAAILPILEKRRDGFKACADSSRDASRLEIEKLLKPEQKERFAAMTRRRSGERAR